MFESVPRGNRVSDPKTETAAVLDANQAFYGAMRKGDIQAMDRLWARGRRATCTHPGGPAIVGRGPVIASWRMILTRHPPPITAVDEHAVVTGNSAMVLCREILGSEAPFIELIATNTWTHENGAWRIVNHQAAQIPGSSD